MKKLSLLLAIIMLIGCSGLTGALAEDTASTESEYRVTFSSYDQVNEAITIIEGTDTQTELGYLDGVTTILEVDGLKFKDLNDNGELDVYEDWRADVEDRVWDLINQMTIEEKTGLFYHVNTCGNSSGVDFADERNMFSTENPFDVPEEGEEVSGPMTSGSYSMWYYIQVLGITSHLDNTNGAPEKQVVYHNAMQALGEDTRLGIPILISNDRQYNAWGGMIDTAHDAFGAANDPELAAKLWTQYSLESRAVGIHVVLHPYSMELGSWNGEDPEYVGTMAKLEIESIQVEGGTEACAKHFIARGGDSSFSNARSDAQTVDNWMTAWSIALEASPKWLMTNGYSTGLTNTVHVDYDEPTMTYLRETLGYEGIIVSDWGAQGADNSSGITSDGVNLDEFTIPERYAYTINLGLDQIGSPASEYNVENPGYTSDRGAVQEAYEQGLITEERINETCYRVLKDRFELGLFENPYSDADYALSLAASDEYIAESWEITDLETLTAARNPETVELERQLQAESAILIKNDDKLLPLEKGTKVYIDSTASEITLEGYKEVLPDYAELVDNIEDADVVVADCTQINDAAELMIDDAKDAGKKLVIVANCIDPDTYLVENADALLALTFSRPADHGTGAGGFITTTEPIMLAKLLFGDAEPQGMVVKEIARDDAMEDSQWADLAGDQGASDYVRMMLLATMKTSENNTTPNNWGDPLLQYQYGMRYGEEPEFVYDTLVLPRVDKEVTTESNGSTTTSVESFVETKAGEPFDVYCLLWNNGADGITTVQVKCDDEVIAEKIMAVTGDSWRVVEISVTIDEPGEHVITVGDLTKTINIVE